MKRYRNILSQYFKKRCKHGHRNFSQQETRRILEVKDYSDIPGPKGFLGMGTLLFNYFPYFGKYSWDQLHLSSLKKYLEYGPIVKERYLPGQDLVILFDPEDIALVMNDYISSGVYPQRRSHLALKKYRKDRPNIYRTGGLLPTNGEEWWQLRSELQKGLSAPRNVRNFLPIADEVTQDFIELCIEDHFFIPDLLPSIERLNLELVCLLAFDIRMNAFSPDESYSDTVTTRLIKAAKVSNSCILPLDKGFLWHFFETPKYKALIRSQEFLEHAAIDLVTQKLTFYQEDPPDENDRSLLDGYLRNPNLNLQDIVGMAADLLLAGVDTTSYATSFLLYHISTNPDVQEKLYEESKTVLPEKEGDTIDPAVLASKAPYAKAVLKESLRLNPVAVGVGRILNQDMVLSNYKVPKGTVVLVQTQVPSILEENFKNADKFIPERWLRSDDGKKVPINPYLSLPFGHGMRSCIARRFAEQNILVFILRLMQKYKITWAGDPIMTYSTKLINVPDQPIALTFQQRT